MRLWDCYSGLLTSTQQDITNLYFNYDLTVSEIAAQKNISRQAVSECLAGCKKQLGEYESKLKFAENNTKYGLEVSFMLTDATRWAEKFAAAHPEYGGDIKELINILNGDYSAAAAEAFNGSEGRAAYGEISAADGGKGE